MCGRRLGDVSSVQTSAWDLLSWLLGSVCVQTCRATRYAPDSPSIGFRGIVAEQQLDHLLTDPIEASAKLDEHLGGSTLALADQTEQDVLGSM